VAVHAEFATTEGSFTVRLFDQEVPETVANFVGLAEGTKDWTHPGTNQKMTNTPFYDGIVFHRVIEGFMAQTGDPTGTGTGGSDLPNIPAEFTQEPFKRGSVGMARSSSPNSANSQFFICYEGCGSLTGQYTLFGEVVAGMDVVDKIKKGNQGNNGQVSGPDKIVKMQLAADAR